MSAEASATTWTTTAVARGWVSALAGQSGVPHAQTSCSLPAATVPRASARRWAMVRGSASQTWWAIWVSRRSNTAASLLSNEPHSDVAPLPSSSGPITTSRPRAPARVRRTASESCRSTMASMAIADLATDSGPKRLASSARVVSTRRMVSGSVIKSVCQTIAVASRVLMDALSE